MQIPQPEEPPSLLRFLRKTVGIALCISVITAQTLVFPFNVVAAPQSKPALEVDIAKIVSIALEDVNQTPTLVNIEVGKSNATIEAERVEAERIATENAKRIQLEKDTAIRVRNAQEAAKKAKTVKATPTPIQRELAPPASYSGADIMRAVGIPESDWRYVEFIIAHEAGWVPCKVNGGAINCGYEGPKAYGICQSKPGTKMATMGSDWRTNPVTQLRWCDAYAKRRYGSWAAAYQYWIAKRVW